MMPTILRHGRSALLAILLAVPAAHAQQTPEQPYKPTNKVWTNPVPSQAQMARMQRQCARMRQDMRATKNKLAHGQSKNHLLDYQRMRDNCAAIRQFEADSATRHGKRPVFAP